MHDGIKKPTNLANPLVMRKLWVLIAHPYDTKNTTWIPCPGNASRLRAQHRRPPECRADTTSWTNTTTCGGPDSKWPFLRGLRF
jgi:hypothetical protein